MYSVSKAEQMNPSEKEFLKSYDPNLYPRPSVAVDVVVLTADGDRFKVLLTRRKEHPFLGQHALPGGFVGIDESLEEAAKRVLATKAGLGEVFVEQLFTFGAPQRDPRMRVVSVAYYALVPPTKLHGINGDTVVASLDIPFKGEVAMPVDAFDDVGELELAFDHADILGMAIARIRGKLSYTNIGFELLPQQFTLFQLRMLYQTILGHELNKDSFR
ncbi:MAG: NUDIX hydrolase, partial [Proteobacteria bacterium]|nr:NUDIX hydrolase [Pseudomonadota bacterium]